MLFVIRFQLCSTFIQFLHTSGMGFESQHQEQTNKSTPKHSILQLTGLPLRSETAFDKLKIQKNMNNE